MKNMKRLLDFLFSLGARLSQDDVELIRDLVEINPGQMSVQEYSRIAKAVLGQPGCQLLVYGVGRDSNLWSMLVERVQGRVVFLEDNDEWIGFARDANVDIEIIKVKYNSLMRDWDRHLMAEDQSKLLLDLPHWVHEVDWDVIVVDGPKGGSFSHPGRMKSIYTASVLANSNTHVFVHDCDRVVEQMFCEKFLRPGRSLRETGKLYQFS